MIWRIGLVLFVVEISCTTSKISTKMIVISVDSFYDTRDNAKIYEGLENISVHLHNPTREQVALTLATNRDKRVLCTGHGSPSGLLAPGWEKLVIDDRMAPLLKDKEMIGFWCHASDFAYKHGLHGFFSSMFISNLGEAVCEGYDEADELDIQAENLIFFDSLNRLLRSDIPLSEWPQLLYENCHKEKGFVDYNYMGLSYLK